MKYVIFLLFLPFCTYSQSTKVFTETITGSGDAKGGSYGYEAVIKYQLRNQGSNDIVLQLGIMEYKITSYKKGNIGLDWRTSPVQDKFPIIMKNHQADVRFNVMLTWQPAQDYRFVYFENLKEGSVRQGALDLYYFDSEQVKEIVSTFDLDTNPERIKELKVEMAHVNIDNDYIGELLAVINRYEQLTKDENKTTNSGNENEKTNSGNEKKYNSYVEREKRLVESNLRIGAAIYKREQEEARREEERKAREPKPSDAYWFDSPEKRAALAKEQNAEGVQKVQDAVQNLGNTMDAAFSENGKKRAARKEAERKQRWKEEREQSYNIALNNYKKGLLSICGTFHDGIALVESYRLDKKYYKSDDPFFNVDVLKARWKEFFIDRNGDNAFGKYWESAQEFHNGIALVEDKEGYFYINTNGDPITTRKYEWAQPKFIGDYATVRNNGKYGLVNLSGTEVVPILYDDIGEMHDGLIKVKKGENYGYVDNRGNVIIPFKFLQAGDFKNGQAIVVETDDLSNQKRIDKNGNVLGILEFDEVYDYSEGMAKVRIGASEYSSNGIRSYGFVDENGMLVIPVIYDNAYSFQEGVAGVYKDDKFGFINKKGETVIPFQYDAGFWFKKGLGIVKKKTDGSYGNNRIWGLINKENEFVISFEEGYKFLGFLEEGLISAKKKENRYGFIDRNGKVVIPFKYYHADSFKNGMAKVTTPIKCTSMPLTPDLVEGRGIPDDCENASEPFYIDKRGRCVKDCNNVPKGFK
jgi:hypothetical protein